jgi:hypothetical protein
MYFTSLSQILVKVSKDIRIKNSYVQYEEYPGGPEQFNIFNTLYLYQLHKQLSEQLLHIVRKE